MDGDTYQYKETKPYLASCAQSPANASPKGLSKRIFLRPARELPFSIGTPFGVEDITGGVENELQAVVKGGKDHVDLPVTIEMSNYYANLVRRFAAGETPRRILSDLDSYLNDNKKNIWENSWVRFPHEVLTPFARGVFAEDLLAQKGDPSKGPRSDVDRFVLAGAGGEKLVRIPVSYLLKLSLADVIGSGEESLKMSTALLDAAKRLLCHFSNDNSSPETFSFHVVRATRKRGLGESLARETLKRYLLTQLLTGYANTKFMLSHAGQEAMVYFAPQPPMRQRRLNECIADGFYRELFMSPCLSGWDDGEAKHRYMQLCHEVLSRSQLNALGKLRDAGVITRNLVILPNVSNVSLANNGTHVSLGSCILSRMLHDQSPDFNRAHEKYLGDLAIKLIEHFLPLFPVTYSASPYRMAFTDFHPEKALGFLPHELDFTHLRMIWRRWKSKAHLTVLGRPVTPFGPLWLDNCLSRLLGLRGDFLPDYRLIDYFVCLMSTERSPALDGSLGNGERLKKDLKAMGVFHDKMALYQLYRLREHHVMGFSGFEGRHYSVFHRLREDMGRAADLQALITAWAYRRILEGTWRHDHIPDSPFVESERRQIFFGTSIGIPTFFVHCRSTNAFIQEAVGKCAGVRASRRYPGYWRVRNLEYRKALVRFLKGDAVDLIEAFQMEDTIKDLESRLEEPEQLSACSRIVQGVLRNTRHGSPMQIKAQDFNEATEEYYREQLRREHMAEAFEVIEEDAAEFQRCAFLGEESLRGVLASVLGEQGALDFTQRVKKDAMEGSLPLRELEKLIWLVLAIIGRDVSSVEEEHREPPSKGDATPVCGSTVG